MDWFFPTIGTGVLSALVPVINIEAGLLVLAANESVPVWPLAIAAALGQMLGKIAYYYLGRSSLEWGWVRRKTDQPKFRAALERWRERTEGRPVYAAAVTFASASVGLPPFAIVAVLAGTLRMSFPVFLAVGFVGRVLRFAGVLGAAGWFFG